VDAGITEFHTALRLKPGYAKVHSNLGAALYTKGFVDDAIAEFRMAVRLKPNLARAHTNLGAALQVKGLLDEAIAEYRTALGLEPDNAEAHQNLGGALQVNGLLDEAIAESRAALRLTPDLAGAHCNLGLVLLAQGHLDDAVRELRLARDQFRTGTPQQSQADHDLARAERLVALAGRLPAVLQCDDGPADVAERVEFAELAYRQEIFGGSARLWHEAFQAQQDLADDMNAQHRYNAACAAALAGCGKGKDDPPLDDNARARWRKQALEWIKADLAAWAKILSAGPPQARDTVRKSLEHWQRDSDLAGVRDAAGLDALPRDEAEAWRTLWRQVESQLATAR
jgi:Flp pilus assembly protein TadD